MTKRLTVEAKKHLACKVDDYEYLEPKKDVVQSLFGEVVQDTGDCLYRENGELIYLKDYNPNDPDSPYCMKYLRGIFKNLSSGKWLYMKMEAKQDNSLINGIYFGVIYTDHVLEEILSVTGFKGGVWE